MFASIALVDLIGVLSVSILSLYLARGASGSNLLDRFLPFLGSMKYSDTLIMFASTAVIALLLKSFSSILFLRIFFRNLAHIESRISSDLLRKCFQLPQKLLSEFSSKNLPSTIVDGSAAVVFGILGNSILIFTELFLLLVLVIPLIIFSPALSLLIGSTFGLSFFVLHKWLGNWSLKNGQTRFDLQNSSRSIVANSGELSKYLLVSKNYEGIFKKFDNEVKQFTYTQSNGAYIQQVPKYVLELTVVFIGIFSGFYFFINDSFGRSLAVLTLIVAPSLRILPSLLRLQGAILYIKASMGESSEFFLVIESFQFEKSRIGHEISRRKRVAAVYKLPQVNFHKVSFKYDDSTNYIIRNLSFQANAGEVLLLEGKSGSGKTTIGDLVLNLLTPTDGEIYYQLSDELELTMSYMPQDTVLFNGSLRENIALGIESEHVNDDRINELIIQLELNQFAPHGAETILGIRGLNISGGQKQRIGLARALYSFPNLLVLDEPTTALDRGTEMLVINAIKKQSESATIIIISHQESLKKIASTILKVPRLGDDDQ
jgi:ABC-type bacteriocin/lantibiotic exporter with double-glycine peptidase domain